MAEGRPCNFFGWHAPVNVFLGVAQTLIYTHIYMTGNMTPPLFPAECCSYSRPATWTPIFRPQTGSKVVTYEIMIIHICPEEHFPPLGRSQLGLDPDLWPIYWKVGGPKVDQKQAKNPPKMTCFWGLTSLRSLKSGLICWFKRKLNSMPPLNFVSSIQNRSQMPPTPKKSQIFDQIAEKT